MNSLSEKSRQVDISQPIGWHEFTDANSLAAQLALDVASRLQAGLAARGSASLIVSGGRTPIRFFEALSAIDLAWDRVTISLADERWVDPGGVDSNEKTLRDHLLVGMARRATFIPLKTDAPNPETALIDSTRAISTMKRPFDVVMLGMGDDGHTASLFPGAAGLAYALDASADPALVATLPPGAPHPRMSMNVAALLDARQIIVLIQGAKKRAVLDSAPANAVPLLLPIAAILHQTLVPVDVYWSP